MILLARESKIILCNNIHLDKEHVNVLNYTENQMLTLCQTNAQYSKNDYSFIRDRGTIQTDCNYGIALQCNYMAFQNKDYSNKWFFAFIDDVKYLGDNNTEIQYTVDSFATFFPNLSLNKCYVVREHVNDDSIGKNTIPEDLAIGDLISDHSKWDSVFTDIQTYWLVIATNYNPGDVDDNDDPGVRYAGIGNHGGYIQGCQWFAWKLRFDMIGQTSNDNLAYIDKFIKKTGKLGHSDDIQAIFALPAEFFSNSDIATDYRVINSATSGKVYTAKKIISKTDWFTSFDDYPSVKNNKLLCYPYSFMRVSNNSGSYNDFLIEDFGAFDPELPNDIYFGFEGIACNGASCACYPMNYRGLTSNLDNSIVLGKYPTFSWSSDSYTNWLTQNGLNLAVNSGLSLFSGISSVGVGLLSGSGMATAGGIMSVAGTVANTFGTIRNASFLANTAQGNANSGDRNFIFNNLRIRFMRMRCKKEYLEKIDNYFSRFGYKINDTKTPNISGRTYWNYVEIGSNEEIGHGNVPNKFLDEINQIFRKGVTIWHNHANIGNYSLNNTIVST